MREQPGSVIHKNSGHAGTIAATATAVPPHILTSDDVKTYIRKVFDLEERRLDAMMAVVDNAQVYKRQSIFPVEYIVQPRSLEQTSVEYREHAVILSDPPDPAARALSRLAQPPKVRFPEPTSTWHSSAAEKTESFAWKTPLNTTTGSTS